MAMCDRCFTGMDDAEAATLDFGEEEIPDLLCPACAAKVVCNECSETLAAVASRDGKFYSSSRYGVYCTECC